MPPGNSRFLVLMTASALRSGAGAWCAATSGTVIPIRCCVGTRDVPNAVERPQASHRGKSRTLTHEAFVERATGCCPDIEIVDRYAGANTRLAVRCRTCGYTWDAFPATVLRSCSCPCCTNRVAVEGVNDLTTTHPQIAAEWDRERNGKLKPTDVVAGSSKRVWWKCRYGHEWQAVVYRRKAGGGSCPVCGK